MSQELEDFRDSIGTIYKDGSRNWLFPKRPVGKFYNWRTFVSVLYLTVFLVLPWIKYNGAPLFLFDIFNRKFILFGVIFWPQDFFLFVLGMLTFMVFIVLFTVVFGRIFCGWVCPQTIFMEMVFRKIEYWIEGDGDAQKRLKNAEWSPEKIKKRVLKFSIFYVISFIIANYFLSYLIGMDNVVLYMKEGVFKHIATFIPLVLFTTIFFAVYTWFREQVCLIVCPYGRLQGVLLDRDSIVVAYDYVRGEPRGKFRKNYERNKGDCVDCHECVKVCPTGIDIRNGTQLECVNCTACIDACDAIMTKFNFDQGLIRYASENNIAKKEKLRFTSRIAAYTGVLSLLIVVLSVLLITRQDIDATVMRAKGTLYQEQSNGSISNLYNIKLINKTRKNLPVVLKIEGEKKGVIRMVGNDLNVASESVGEGIFFVDIAQDQLSGRKNKIEIGVYSNDKRVELVKTTFFAPNI
jgi:cytochrome c oxidase accessory protein FixG